MPRANYQPKRFVNDIISSVFVSDDKVNPEEVVTAVGMYGERGIMVYPYASEGDPTAKCGISLLGRGANPDHFNLSREDAVDIVALLVNEYDMNVSVERSTVVNVR